MSDRPQLLICSHHRQTLAGCSCSAMSCSREFGDAIPSFEGNSSERTKSHQGPFW